MNTIYPPKGRFSEIGKNFNLVPVYTEIVTDMQTPVSVYKKVSSRSGGTSFLLESVEGGEKWGRYSFIGFSPIAVMESRGEDVKVRIEETERTNVSDDPLRDLESLMAKFSYYLPEDFPRLSCGAVGYIGYDYVSCIENIPDNTSKNHGYPDLFFLVPSVVIAFDNLMQKTRIIKNVYLKPGSDGEHAYDEAVREIESIVSLVVSTAGSDEADFQAAPPRTVELSPLMSDEEMMKRITRTKEHIRNGEAIQVVLSNKYTGVYEGDPFNVYRALRVINPSPYMFYIEGEDVKIAGSSPEVLVRLDKDEVILRPIAGTRPRGKSDGEDNLMEADLLSDPKELSEHLMLVDLGRNDLGRISKAGTVKVNEFMVIEKYSHVMHIVSNITSILEKGNNAFTVLRATFPAGTVTGAPKIRAMEIIEEFEVEKRGIYAGAVGYFDFSGNMDCCITIRTIIFDRETAVIQAGAGIVYDSVPEKEIEEIENKTTALKKAMIWGIQNDRGNR